MTTAPKAKAAAPKATPKAAPQAESDVFSFPNMPSLEMSPVFRDMAENSVQKSKEAYEKFRASAEEATSLLEDTIEKTRDSVVEFNSKALEVAQENTEATFSHVKDVFAVKSFSEAVELQTSFMKKQAEALQDQTKMFQEMATKLTEDTTAPYKAAFEKTAEAFKVA